MRGEFLGDLATYAAIPAVTAVAAAYWKGLSKRWGMSQRASTVGATSRA
jgi:hypothetical protein